MTWLLYFVAFLAYLVLFDILARLVARRYDGPLGAHSILYSLCEFALAETIGPKLLIVIFILV